MSRRITAYPCPAQRVTIWAVPAGFTLLDMVTYGHLRWILAEHGDGTPLELWQISIVEQGEELPLPTDGAAPVYAGSFVQTEKQERHIKVAGSPGMQQADDLLIHIFAIYIQRANPLEVPAEAMERFIVERDKRNAAIAAARPDA